MTVNMRILHIRNTHILCAAFTPTTMDRTILLSHVPRRALVVGASHDIVHPIAFSIDDPALKLTFCFD